MDITMCLLTIKFVMGKLFSISIFCIKGGKHEPIIYKVSHAVISSLEYCTPVKKSFESQRFIIIHESTVSRLSIK